jgi:hypothetical protein
MQEKAIQLGDVEENAFTGCGQMIFSVGRRTRAFGCGKKVISHTADDP